RLELPADRPRPAQQDFRGSFVGLELDAEETAGLRALSRRHNTTLYMTLLAGWAALLCRLSGQPDVVIGTPSANRGHREIEGLFGFFVTTLSLRMDLSDAPVVSDLLERVKAQTLAAQQHQDIPFEQVVELMQPVRSTAHSPLFQVLFAWQNTPPGTLELPGLAVQPVAAVPHQIAKFDLTLSLQESGETITGGIEYATALFDPATIDRCVVYFRNLLRAMVADASQPVDRLPLLPSAELDQVLYGWNATSRAYASEQCVHALFEEQAARTPDAVALVYEDGELSYGELNDRANRLAHHLLALGVQPDDRVALCVERGFAMVVALLAVLKAGGAYVPLDPAYPQERLRFMLEDSAPVALLTQVHLSALLPETSGVRVLLDDAEQPWRDRPSGNPTVSGLTSRHLAYIIYTSGSTGTPKGVMVEHRHLAI